MTREGWYCVFFFFSISFHVYSQWSLYGAHRKDCTKREMQQRTDQIYTIVFAFIEEINHTKCNCFHIAEMELSTIMLWVTVVSCNSDIAKKKAWNLSKICPCLNMTHQCTSRGSFCLSWDKHLRKVERLCAQLQNTKEKKLAKEQFLCLELRKITNNIS